MIQSGIDGGTIDAVAVVVSAYLGAVVVATAITVVAEAVVIAATAVVAVGTSVAVEFVSKVLPPVGAVLLKKVVNCDGQKGNLPLGGFLLDQHGQWLLGGR